MPDSEPATTAPAGLASGKWGDLGQRIVSAIVLLGVTIAALWLGGIAWALLVMVVAVLMGWELARLCDPGIPAGRSLPLGLSYLVPLVVLAIPFLTGAGEDEIRAAQYMSWAAMLVSPLLGLVLLSGGRWIWVAYGTVIQLGAQYFLFTGLDPWGLAWLLSVVTIVMISDILGYFAGRLLGGPKFWPRISPKKTWSGTVAGWIGAALFGALVMSRGDLIGSPLLGALSAMAIAFAGQMGDIAASAIKRRVGVKDASHLIPGHGGFLDRLDAMIAAAAVTIVWLLVF